MLLLPQLAVKALREQLQRQADDRSRAGALWQDHDLVFASTVGTPWIITTSAGSSEKITEAAGLGTDWVPREMRHTFVSQLSFKGTPLEDIADLVGHKGTVTPETVYGR